MLSNPVLDEKGVYGLVPMERLVVDEASQISVSEYMVSGICDFPYSLSLTGGDDIASIPQIHEARENVFLWGSKPTLVPHLFEEEIDVVLSLNYSSTVWPRGRAWHAKYIRYQASQVWILFPRYPVYVVPLF